MTITIDAQRYADHDDCLSAAAADYAAEHGLEGWDLDPRWGDDDRETIVLTVPPPTKDTTITIDVTNRQISAMRGEAAVAGDSEQVEICDRALDGDDDARRDCAAAIAAAAAMDDGAAPL